MTNSLSCVAVLVWGNRSLKQSLKQKMRRGGESTAAGGVWDTQNPLHLRYWLKQAIRKLIETAFYWYTYASTWEIASMLVEHGRSISSILDKSLAPDKATNRGLWHPYIGWLTNKVNFMWGSIQNQKLKLWDGVNVTMFWELEWVNQTQWIIYSCLWRMQCVLWKRLPD